MESRALLPPIGSPKIAKDVKLKQRRGSMSSVAHSSRLLSKKKTDVILRTRRDSKATTYSLPPVQPKTKPLHQPSPPRTREQRILKDVRRVSIRKSKAPRKLEEPQRRRSQIEQLDAQSEDILDLVALLDDQLTVEDVDLVGTPSDILSSSFNSFTPPPQYIADYGKQLERFPDHVDGPYKPKRCWCTRCQIIYRMHMENDHSLDNWGNYPCHQF
jgi:hypothetical protein